MMFRTTNSPTLHRWTRGRRWVIAAALTVVFLAPAVEAQNGTARATFAGGCFWCMEKPFDELEGVISTVSGYAGGHVEDPTYEQVTKGGTGHAEVVQITYDPEVTDYDTLLYVFWRNVDPFDDGGQFCDRGDSYRTGIFYHTDEQRRRAETSKREVAARFSQEIVTPIEPLDAFYRAEDYHQNYYKRSPIRYRFYRSACGRDARLEAVWGDEAGGYHLVGEARTGSRRGGPADEPTQTRSRTDGPRQEEVSRLVGDIEVDGKPYVVSAERYDPENRIIHDQRADIDYPVQLSERAWRRRLDSFEYRILRQAGTERAFSGDLYDNKRAGTYYSAASGQPVFHSEDKYTSGTGWPSFTKPISPDAVAYKWDRGIFSRRIEVVDSLSGSHLGHVFTDGPDPTGQRYCINSAALIFVPEGEKPPEMLGP